MSADDGRKSRESGSRGSTQAAGTGAARGFGSHSEVFSGDTGHDLAREPPAALWRMGWGWVREQNENCVI